jgi:hypothetical protein
MRTRALLLTAVAVTAAPASGQSLFNSAGMGLPVEALDGRARALGNLGIGLRGGSLMPTDPAAVAGYRLATGVMASQPSWVEYAQDGGSTGTFQGTRFPLIGLAYPVFSGMMSVQIGSFLDQRFISEVPGTVDLGGSQVAVTDRFNQNGAVSNLNVGYARMLGPRFSAGATLGRYAGSVVRTLERSFDDASLGVEDYVEQGKWSYTGHSLTAGVAADLTDGVRVAASVQLPTDLDADASATTDGADGSFDLPIQLRVGASAQLASGLVVTGSAVLADWSSTADDLGQTTTVGDANGFGAGIELARARLLGKEAPLRFGYRKTGLPFSFASGSASERVFAGGFGLVLNQTDEIVLAGADFGLERGRRSGGGVTEDFWRLTFSIVVSGL